MDRLWVCVLAGLLVISTGCSPADHYRAHHDGESLYAVMHDSVRTGDSVAKVEGLLGPGRHDAGEKTLGAMKKMGAKNPSGWPAGVRDDDRVIGYPFDDGSTLWLQFRNGKLINHNPGDFARYEPIASVISSQPAPR